jgi:hypothetical protein
VTPRSWLITLAAATAILIFRPTPGRATLSPTPPNIAFVRRGEIWAARGDGTGQRRVIPSAESPAWSPDHRRLAFARRGEVWIANADGSGARQLTRPTGSRTAGLPLAKDDYPRLTLAWDPKSRMILFSAPELFEVGPVGGARRRLVTQTLFEVSQNVKSPVEPGRLLDLTDTEAASAFSETGHPAFSRSGALAFVRNGDIWRADRGEKSDPYPRAPVDQTLFAWGWDMTRLATVASYDAPTYRGSRENGYATHLSWSPDALWLAYDLQRVHGSGTETIEVLEVRTGKRRGLGVYGVGCCFSPDGKSLAFTDLAKGSIALIAPRGGAARTVIPNGEQPAW